MSEQPKKMVRFDFPPGATSKQIAEAIQAAREKAVKEYAEAKARAEKSGK